jgi:hypothetical protein
LQPGTTTSYFGRSPPRLHAKLARDVPAWDAQCAAACPLCSNRFVQAAVFKTAMRSNGPLPHPRRS